MSRDNSHHNSVRLVSVIVPIFDGEEFLPQALDSIGRQTHSDLEIICISDGSPDNSEAIVANYWSRDPRFRLVSQENRGLSETLNRGFAEARGDYVLLVAQDDALHPEAVEAALGLSMQHDADVTIFNYREFPQRTDFGNLETEPIDTLGLQHTGLSSGIDRIVKGFVEDWWEPRTQLFLLKREFLQQTGLAFFPGILHEDNLFTYQLLLRAERIVESDAVFSFVRQTIGSMSRATTSWNHVYSLLITLGEAHRECRERSRRKSLRHRIAMRYVLHNVLNQAVDAYKKTDESNRNILEKKLSSVTDSFHRLAVRRFRRSSHSRFGWIVKGVRHWWWKGIRRMSLALARPGHQR